MQPVCVLVACCDPRMTRSSKALYDSLVSLASGLRKPDLPVRKDWRNNALAICMSHVCDLITSRRRLVSFLYDQAEVEPPPLLGRGSSTCILGLLCSLECGRTRS